MNIHNNKSKEPKATSKAPDPGPQQQLEEAEEIKEIDFPFNDKIFESYKKHGLKAPESIEFSQEKVFLNLVDTDEKKGNGPIERVLTRVVRTKERDWSTGRNVTFKEWIWYTENWFGNNWMGEKIAPVTEHLEGVYQEQEVETTRDRDMRTGRLLEAKTTRTGEHSVYYIPFTKEKVKEIVGDRDPAGIVFTIKFPGNVSGDRGIRNNFTYEQFLNMSLEEAFKLNSKQGGPAMNPLSASGLSFQPG